MRKKLGLLFLIMLFSFSYGNIDENQMIANSELDGEIILIFKDAVTNEALENVDLTLIRKDDKGNKSQISLKTDSQGLVSFDIEIIENIMDGKLYVIAQKEGYIKFIDVVSIMVGTVFRNTFAMTKNIPLEKVRFVLNWAKKPRDLDLHLEGKNVRSTDFHISYRDKRSIPNLAKLDRDDVNGYGPETITLDNIEEDGLYRLFVNNYSGEKNIKADAVVHVYANNKLNRIINLKETFKKNVEVLKIESKEIQYTNIAF